MSEEEEYLSDEDEELELPPWTEGLEVRLDRAVRLYRNWVAAWGSWEGGAPPAWLPAGRSFVCVFVCVAPGRVGVTV